MKSKIAEAVQDAPSDESVGPEELQRYFAKFEESFFIFCKKGKFPQKKNLGIFFIIYKFLQIRAQ